MKGIRVQANSLKLLIIEDDPTTLELIKMILGRYDHKLFTADSGEKGLEMVREATPDLILLDFRLGSMSASDIVKRMGAEGIDVPFIVITGYEHPETIDEMRQLGAKDYIIKSSSFMDDLHKVVSKVTQEIVENRKGEG